MTDETKPKFYVSRTRSFYKHHRTECNVAAALVVGVVLHKRSVAKAVKAAQAAFPTGALEFAQVETPESLKNFGSAVKELFDELYKAPDLFFIGDEGKTVSFLLDEQSILSVVQDQPLTELTVLELMRDYRQGF